MALWRFVCFPRYIQPGSQPRDFQGAPRDFRRRDPRRARSPAPPFLPRGLALAAVHFRRALAGALITPARFPHCGGPVHTWILPLYQVRPGRKHFLLRAARHSAPCIPKETPPRDSARSLAAQFLQFPRGFVQVRADLQR